MLMNPRVGYYQSPYADKVLDGEAWLWSGRTRVAARVDMIMIQQSFVIWRPGEKRQHAPARCLQLAA